MTDTAGAGGLAAALRRLRDGRATRFATYDTAASTDPDAGAP
jgi:hypothetical protein